MLPSNPVSKKDEEKKKEKNVETTQEHLEEDNVGNLPPITEIKEPSLSSSSSRDSVDVDIDKSSSSGESSTKSSKDKEDKVHQAQAHQESQSAHTTPKKPSPGRSKTRSHKHKSEETQKPKTPKLARPNITSSIPVSPQTENILQSGSSSTSSTSSSSSSSGSDTSASTSDVSEANTPAPVNRKIDFDLPPSSEPNPISTLNPEVKLSLTSNPKSKPPSSPEKSRSPLAATAPAVPDPNKMSAAATTKALLQNIEAVIASYSQTEGEMGDWADKKYNEIKDKYPGSVPLRLSLGKTRLGPVDIAAYHRQCVNGKPTWTYVNIGGKHYLKANFNKPPFYPTSTQLSFAGILVKGKLQIILGDPESKTARGKRVGHVMLADLSDIEETPPIKGLPHPNLTSMKPAPWSAVVGDMKMRYGEHNENEKLTEITFLYINNKAGAFNEVDKNEFPNDMSEEIKKQKIEDSQKMILAKEGIPTDKWAYWNKGDVNIEQNDEIEKAYQVKLNGIYETQKILDEMEQQKMSSSSATTSTSTSTSNPVLTNTNTPTTSASTVATTTTSSHQEQNNTTSSESTQTNTASSTSSTSSSTQEANHPNQSPHPMSSAIQNLGIRQHPAASAEPPSNTSSDAPKPSKE